MVIDDSMNASMGSYTFPMAKAIFSFNRGITVPEKYLEPMMKLIGAYDYHGYGYKFFCDKLPHLPHLFISLAKDAVISVKPEDYTTQINGDCFVDFKTSATSIEGQDVWTLGANVFVDQKILFNTKTGDVGFTRK
eukprot:TRINITY_DN6881_c0_g1_i3.p1 TRINITY_DN6881_c0_g1~~TRINITY_DN6881_c0_g1_i3.p1  ORF type:complete len:135 (-),score=26.09 TRINITY_DN6881_c0_g1_i3:211-615(-)